MSTILPQVKRCLTVIHINTNTSNETLTFNAQKNKNVHHYKEEQQHNNNNNGGSEANKHRWKKRKKNTYAVTIKSKFLTDLPVPNKPYGFRGR